ncbi:MAG: hypothetical protein V2I33_21505 [Kangiellaceae bacterium]|nr:hypothetical protein [Kangiellaceae bacterium]
MYDTFKVEADRLGIEILNDEALRKIPYGDKELMIQHIDSFQNIIDVGARVVILVFFSPMPKNAIEILYDLGVRRGDMAFMGIEWLSENLAVEPPEEDAIKR